MKHICCSVLLLFTLSVCRGQYGYDTIKIYFPINVSSLDAKARNTLDSVLKVAGNTRRMLLYGYADYLGKEPANEVLARNRAQTVQQYLLSHKVARKRIPVCEGIAEVRRPVVASDAGFPEDRRVALFLQRLTAAPGAARKKSGMRVTELPPNPETLPQTVPVAKKVSKPEQPAQSQPVVKANTPVPPPLPGSKFERLAAMEAGDILRIESIHFKPTKHFITRESEPILLDLYNTLLRHPALRIRIEGHVCCIRNDGDALDTDTYEFNLSESRAHFIYDFLVNKGIAKDRLEYIGYGKRRPIVTLEQTEEEAQQNRRVEFRVLEN